MFRDGLEVLRGGGEVAFVSCTGDAPQTHALEAVVDLEVRKAHLDFLALIAGAPEAKSSPPQRGGDPTTGKSEN